MTPTIRAGLKELIGTLAGVPCVWRDEQRPFADGGVIALLSLRSLRREGGGSDVVYMGELADELTSSHVQGILTVLVESFDHAAPAADRLMAVRARLERHYALEALEALGCTVFDAQPIQDLGTSYDKRARSCASLDLSIRAMVTETQAAFDNVIGSPTAPSVIEAVEVNDDLIGTPLPEPEDEEEEEEP